MNNCTQTQFLKSLNSFLGTDVAHANKVYTCSLLMQSKITPLFCKAKSLSDTRDNAVFQVSKGTQQKFIINRAPALSVTRTFEK